MSQLFKKRNRQVGFIGSVVCMCFCCSWREWVHNLMTICFGADNTIGDSLPVNELFWQVFVETSLELSLVENNLSFLAGFFKPRSILLPTPNDCFTNRSHTVTEEGVRSSVSWYHYNSLHITEPEAKLHDCFDVKVKGLPAARNFCQCGPSIIWQS